MGSIRTFIAFDTPTDIRTELASLQEKLKTARADVRWESSDKFHATIKFLGDVDESILPEIINDIRTVTSSHQPFTVTYKNLGCFPDIRHPRVLWVGCENTDGTLERLKNVLDTQLAARGFEIEKRTFHPHITLGREKSSRRLEYLTPMLENLTFEPHTTMITEIIIMKSVLQPQGATYTVLKTLSLSSH
jgi:2'-5' RNA ligase